MIKYFISAIFFLGCLAPAFTQDKETILADIAKREGEATQLAEEQLNAYNAKNIDAFLRPYADDVEVYTFPNTLRYKGKDAMRQSYEGFFKNAPNVKATITQRIVYGSQVIDYEELTGLQADLTIKAVAIYIVENGKISKVYFLRQL